MAARPHLHRLAHDLGILPFYLDNDRRRRATSNTARVALLAAMGVDAATEAAAARARRVIEKEAAARQIAPVRVVSMPEAARPLRISARDLRGSVAWEVVLHAEDGALARHEGKARMRAGVLHVPLPVRPSPGYHRLGVTLDVPGSLVQAEQSLIVTPRSCFPLAARTGGKRAFGIAVNLYAVRSARNWGAGDLSDLRTLAEWSGGIGAGFLGINPLHALRNRDWAVSPYSPVSRLYRNPLYVDVTEVPELSESSEARALAASASMHDALAERRHADWIDYARVMALKRPVLEALHRTFAASHRGRDTPRGLAYRRYLESEGECLEDFATWVAMDEDIARESGSPRAFRDWPTAYQDPRSPAVVAFRAANPEAVDYHKYVQFELDRQLGEASRSAAEAGLGLGIYEDLAIGTAPDGCDPWAFPGLFLDGASLGAPPDDYARQGQDWGLPPIDPRRLQADGYRYWIRVLRAALAHAGALRIDHIMGLFRQFWVPRGRSARQGAYVRYPATDLLGILALESRRAGAVVIGEDLGTVPRGLSTTMARWEILSTRVLYFERDKGGGYRSSRRFLPRALVAVNTHDHPPLAGFWSGRDLVLRRRTGSIVSEAALALALAGRARERRSLIRRLVAEGILPPGAVPEVADLVAAVHAFLARTPCALLEVSLDDLFGEEAPVNLPGVPPDRYPSWMRRPRKPLEALVRDPGVRRALAGAERRTPRRAGGLPRPAARPPA